MRRAAAAAVAAACLTALAPAPTQAAETPPTSTSADRPLKVTLAGVECRSETNRSWVPAPTDENLHLVTTQQECRIRLAVTPAHRWHPTSCTPTLLDPLRCLGQAGTWTRPAGSVTVTPSYGGVSLAPEILRGDLLDEDCATPVTDYTWDASTRRDGLLERPDWGGGASPVVHWLPVAGAKWGGPTPDWLAVAPGAGGSVTLSWPEASHPTPATERYTPTPTPTPPEPAMIGPATVSARFAPPDGHLMRPEHGCFITGTGALHYVFYRGLVEFTASGGAPLPLAVAVKDNDNGPYSANHPAATRRDPPAPPPPRPERGTPPAGGGDPRPAGPTPAPSPAPAPAPQPPGPCDMLPLADTRLDEEAPTAAGDAAAICD